MKRTGKSRETEERYIVLDIRKEYMLAREQNAGQEWVMPLCLINMERFHEWAIVDLRGEDAVMIETTTNV